jgi:hypothetical protein
MRRSTGCRSRVITTILETVIPAQAGTYNTSPKLLSFMAHGCMLWVPAFAGMTCWWHRDHAFGIPFHPAWYIPPTPPGATSYAKQ